MRKKTSILLALLSMIISTLACSLFTGGTRETSLENLRMAYDQEGNFETNVFAPSDILYAVADLNNAPAGTVVDAQWLVVDIEGYDEGELIFEQSIDDFADENYSGSVYFQLSNDDAWLVGEYKVDVYLDGNFVTSAPFSVR